MSEHWILSVTWAQLPSSEKSIRKQLGNSAACPPAEPFSFLVLTAVVSLAPRSGEALGRL